MFLNLKKVLLAKEESVYGSDPTPTVADNAIEAKNIRVNYRGDVLERNLQRGTLSPSEPKIGKRWIEVAFECELKGSGSAGTAPKLGDLLEACGMSETVSAGSSVTYLPSSGTMKSVTLYVYDKQDSGSAVLHKVTGARGNFNIVAEAGQIARAEFTLRGIYNAPTDVADPSAPTFESTKPPIVESSQFSLNSVTTLVVQQVSLDMNNELADSDDISSSGSLKSVNIVGRKPAGTFNPEKVSVATYGYWADWIAATSRALSLVVGTVAGNKCTISAPKVTLDNVGGGERNGVVVEDVPFRCAYSSGNDEVSLVFA